MANKNTIVGAVVRIDPSVDKPGVEMFKAFPEGVSITFEGDQTARLKPGEQASHILEILEELRRIEAPGYVEVDPDTREITRLLIPLVVKVANIEEGDTEEVGVELEISHARHVLKRANPDFDQLLKSLRTARENNEWLIVTETDEHEIIDVRQQPRLPEGVTTVKRKGFFGRIFGRILDALSRLYFILLKRRRCSISEKEARAMFNLVSARTCDPLTVPAPCIPFLYPDDGCWGRAHEMCRLIIDAGVTPKKVWIYGSLRVNTKNNPTCSVRWGWHVAPTLCVKRGGSRYQQMVIDPSLFNEPVSKPTWKGVQGDANAQLVDTAASVFYRSFSGSTQTDPNYTQTNQVLATYRLRLKNRSIQSGPPPYANCP